MSSLSNNTPSEVPATNPPSDTEAINLPSDTEATNLPSDTEATNLPSDTEATNPEKPDPRWTSATVSTVIGRIVHVGNGECCICFQAFDDALSPYVFGQCSHCACLNCIQAISLNTGETLCPLCRTGVNSIVAMGGDERTISQTLNTLQHPARAMSPPPMRSPARNSSPPAMRSPARPSSMSPPMRSPAENTYSRSVSPGIAEPSEPVFTKATPVPVVINPSTSDGAFLPSSPHNYDRTVSINDALLRMEVSYALSRNTGSSLGIVRGSLVGVQSDNLESDISFLIDASGSMASEIQNMKNALTKFVRLCNGKAKRISITIFSTYAQNIVGFTLVTDATIGGIIAQIESQVRAIARTNLCGGISYVHRLLDAAAREHPLAMFTNFVLITDGKPDGSIFNCAASFSALMQSYPNMTTSIIALGGNVSLSNLEILRGNYHDQVVLKSARTGAHLDAALNVILEVPPSIGAAISIRFEGDAAPINRASTTFNNVGTDATSEIVSLTAMPIGVGAEFVIPFRAPIEELPTISFTAMVMGVPFSGLVQADETISEEMRTFYPEEQNARATIDNALERFSNDPAGRKQRLEELKHMIESGGESAFGSYYAPLIASITLHITSATIASNPRVSAREKTIAENEAFADRAFSGRSISYQSSARDISDITDVDFMDAALEDVFPANVAPEDAAPVDVAPVDAAPVDTDPVDAATANVALADADLVDAAPEDVAPKDALDMV